MSGITYDTGALIAAERDDREMWALHKRALGRGLIPIVPTAVLAQGWRGGPQPLMSRLLADCRVEPLDEQLARSAGAACGRAGISDIVDAVVVIGAAARRDQIVTSDLDDIVHLGQANGHSLEVREL